MSISANDIELLYKISRKQLPNRNVLSIGNHGISFLRIPPIIAQNFPEKSKIWNKRIKQLRGHEEHFELLKEILLTFDYESYSDMDQNPNAVINIDLSDSIILTEVENNFSEYGVVINNGTLDYVGNIIKAYKFVLSLVSIGGYIISTTDCNSFNRFPTLPSPEFLVDIHDYMGFECDYLKLVDGHNRPFKNYKLNYLRKHTYLFEGVTLFLAPYHFLIALFRIDGVFDASLDRAKNNLASVFQTVF